MMKKILLLLVVLSMTYSAAPASDILFGVKAGMTFSTLSWDPGPEVVMEEDLDEKILWGAARGVFLVYPLSERLSLQGELMLLRKGDRFKASGLSDAVYMTIIADYIELPILIKYKVYNDIHLLAGPAVSYVTDAWMLQEVESGDVHVALESSVDEEIKNLDFSIVFGGQYLFAGRFLTDLRYEMGLADINDSPAGEGPDTIMTRTVTFTVGYIF